MMSDDDLSMLEAARCILEDHGFSTDDIVSCIESARQANRDENDALSPEQRSVLVAAQGRAARAGDWPAVREAGERLRAAAAAFRV